MMRKIAEKFVLNKRIKATKVLPLARIQRHLADDHVGRHFVFYFANSSKQPSLQHCVPWAKFKVYFKCCVYFSLPLSVSRFSLSIPNVSPQKFDYFRVALIELIAPRMLCALTFLFNLWMTFAQVQFPFPLWHTWVHYSWQRFQNKFIQEMTTHKLCTLYLSFSLIFLVGLENKAEKIYFFV